MLVIIIMLLIIILELLLQPTEKTRSAHSKGEEDFLVEILQDFYERIVYIESKIARDYPNMKRDVNNIRAKLKKLEEMKKVEGLKDVKNGEKERT